MISRILRLFLKIPYLKIFIWWMYDNFFVDIIACCPTILGDKLRWLYLKITSKSVGKNFIAHSRTFFFYPWNLEIGDNVGFSGNCIINANAKLTFGNNIMVGPNCNIMTANHSFSRLDIPMIDQGDTVHELVINDDVWLGNGVVISSGARKVEIAKGVVIAANSVVTKSITEPYSIWGGVPAKFIKFRKENGKL